MSEVTTAEQEQAAKAFADAFQVFGEAMQKCIELGVDIPAELEKLGVEVPPFAYSLFGG